jgi:hypothetical protein
MGKVQELHHSFPDRNTGALRDMFWKCHAGKKVIFSLGLKLVLRNIVKIVGDIEVKL